MLQHPRVKVFATTGSEGLAVDVCRELKVRLPSMYQPEGGIALGDRTVERFSNDNLQVQVENVRGYFVVIIHTQVPPVSDHLVELFALLDAINNARPADKLLVLPYMPYARSDRKNKPHISTMGRWLPRVLTESCGIKRVILLDPHEVHVANCFDPIADEISALYLLADHAQEIILAAQPKENWVVVFADAGAAKRFEKFPELLKLPVAYVAKKRVDDKEAPQFDRVVGDVDGKYCLFVDDEILTGKTTIGDAAMLKQAGAQGVVMLTIHAVLDDKKSSAEEVVKRLQGSAIDQFVVTDSIPVHHKLQGVSKFTVLSIAPLLAEAISRTVQDESLSALHEIDSVRLYRPTV